MKKENVMKIHDLKRRLQKDRPTTAVTLTLPTDLLEDAQRVAPHRGFSTPEALLRAYIGQGLRADLERLEAMPNITELIENLKRHGVAEEIITSALAEMQSSREAA